MTDETGAPTTQLDELPTEGDWSQVWERRQGVLEETVTSQQRAFIAADARWTASWATPPSSPSPHRVRQGRHRGTAAPGHHLGALRAGRPRAADRGRRRPAAVDDLGRGVRTPTRRRRRPCRARLPDHERSPDQPPARHAGYRPRAGRPPRDRAHPAQPQVHLRHLRHRLEQPVRARRRRRGRRGAGQGVQPAVHLRRVRPGQDPPAARDRALRAEPVRRGAGALRELGGVHQRLHQLDPRRQGRRLPPALPRRRHPARRRHPVPGEQGADAGGVLPHVQHAAQREQADRDLQRPAAQAAGHPGGPAAQPVRVGPDHRRPAARARDPHRDPAQEGRPGAAGRAAGGAGVHREQDLDATSASSRAR